MRKVHTPVFAVVAVWAAGGLMVVPCAAGPPHFSAPEPSGQGTRSTPLWPRITPNFKDVDIREITETVSDVTGKRFIFDPAVRGNATLICSASLTPAAFYQTFLAILEAHGWIAAPAGEVVKILPDVRASALPASPAADEIMTEVVEVKNGSAERLAPNIREVMPSYGHLMAYTPSNLLVFSDRASDISRLVDIIHRLESSDEGDPPVPAEDGLPSSPEPTK